MSKPKVTDSITDHALLRYMEASMGICSRKAKLRLLTPGLRAALKSGAKKYHEDGFEFRIENGRVVTVLGGLRKNGRR